MDADAKTATVESDLYGRTTKKERPSKKPAAGRPARQRETKQETRRAAYYSRLVPPARTVETHFRHSHWKARRARVRETLVSLNVNELVLNRWDECGSECTVEWNAKEQRARLRANYCRCRQCEPCQRAKAGRMAANLRRRLQQSKAGTIRFITFTLKHRDAPLADQIKRLYATFKEVRSTKLWKGTQIGGAAILEVKHNGTHWHPHLHVMSEGQFINRDRLCDAWYKLTGDSHQVDVRILSNPDDAAHYLTKYVTKGTSPSVWDSVDLSQEWVTATKGVRTANTFGTWRGFKLLAYETTNEGWSPLCSLQRLIDAAARDEAWAVGLLHSIRPPGQPQDVHPSLREDAG